MGYVQVAYFRRKLGQSLSPKTIPQCNSTDPVSAEYQNGQYKPSLYAYKLLHLGRSHGNDIRRLVDGLVHTG